MRKIILIALLFSLNSFGRSKIENYQNLIKGQCTEANVSTLLLKKSLIELVRGFECDGKFTNLIIKKCEQLDCKKISEIYRQIQQAKPGSVVGDD